MQTPILATLRAALCDRIDAAALAAQRQARPHVSLPSALLAAGLYLTDQGVMEPPSTGEEYFAWGPRAYQRYLERLSPATRAEQVEAGRRAVFEGTPTRPPLHESMDKPALPAIREAA